VFKCLRMKRLLILLFVGILLGTCLSAKSLRVAVISDGEDAAVHELIAATSEELKKLLLETDMVDFDKNLYRSGGFDVENIKKAIGELSNVKELDAILAIGPVSSHLLADGQKFKRPVMAAQILNADMQKLPDSNGRSGVDNLSYIDMAIDFGRHMDRFGEIRSFKTLHLIGSRFMLEGVPQLAGYIKGVAEKRGVRVITIQAEKDLYKVVNGLENAEAVYIAPLQDFSEEQKKQLIMKINALKIPSMVMIGTQMVENGAFVSATMETDTKKLARRLALNFQRLLMEENSSSFQTEFSQAMRMTINMQTAREISVYPTWEQMTDAILLNEDVSNVERKLSITEVVETALARNLQIIARSQELKAGEQTVNRARANLKPKINAFARQSMLDDDRAESIMTPAKHSTQIGAELLLVLSSEQASANVDMQKLFQAARKEEERALLLDIIKDASIAYLNVLKTKTLQAIQRDNLEVTRANLEIARFREQVGTSGPAEVYRWEIQMASARQAVIDASAMRKKAEMSLNQILNASQEEEFTTADCDVFSEVFFPDYSRLAPYIDNVHGFKLFRDFLTADTFAFAPEIQQISRAVEAWQRGHRSARRRYNKPVVALQGNFSRTVGESGIGKTKPAMPAPFNSVFSYPDKNDWFVGLNVSIPLFEGGDRPAAVKEAEANLKKLETDREFLMQRLELNTRASLEDARASFSSIRLSGTRAEYAAKTLDLVQSAYTRGAVNILDLIDAQNASLVAREASTNSVFTFLSDFVKVCRAVGTFDFMLSPQTSSSWYERLEYFYRNGGGQVMHERRLMDKPETLPSVSSEKVLFNENEM